MAKAKVLATSNINVQYVILVRKYCMCTKARNTRMPLDIHFYRGICKYLSCMREHVPYFLIASRVEKELFSREAKKMQFEIKLPLQCSLFRIPITQAVNSRRKH